jgi:hypothetical protein
VLADPVAISPGGSIQAAIDAHPPGTIFILPAGTWRKQSIDASPCGQRRHMRSQSAYH